MYLVLNTIIRPGAIMLASGSDIIDSIPWENQGSEYDSLLETIESFLEKNACSVPELEGVLVVRGPGGFTGTRIVSLIVNTWRSLYHIPVSGITLFDVLIGSGGTYPIAIKANRGEYLVQK